MTRRKWLQSGIFGKVNRQASARQFCRMQNAFCNLQTMAHGGLQVFPGLESRATAYLLPLPVSIALRRCMTSFSSGDSS